MKKALIIASIYKFVDHFEKNNIKILQELGYEVTIASNFKDYKNELDNLNIDLVHIPFQRNPFSLKNIIAYKELNKFLKKEKKDLIHCHTPIGGAIGRIIGYKNKVKKIIYTAHGFHFFKGSPLINWLLFYPIEKYLSKYTDILITINQEDYQIAQTFFAKEVKFINGIGIDIKKIKNIEINEKEKRKELGLTEENIVLFSVGELSKRKNHIVLLKALAQIKNNKNIFYLIAGIGPLERYLKEKCKKLRIEKQVKFLGYRKDIYELCKMSDIFIFPSLQEGLPVALMEAIACQIPVLCSKIRGNKDLIKKEEDMFEVHDSKKITELLLSKISNDGKYISRKNLQLKMEDSITKNYKKLSEFDIEEVRKKMKEIYKLTIES